jgi:hypothetical protein
VSRANASTCAIKLAPDYDKAIFDGLTKANEDAMKLFASVKSNPSEAYSHRANAYDSVIGELNAVQVQIKSRSVPTPPTPVLTVAGLLGGSNATQQVPQALDVPTASDVDTLVKIMQRARIDDKAGKLSRRIDLAQEAFAIQMAQALTYEKALQR